MDKKIPVTVYISEKIYRRWLRRNLASSLSLEAAIVQFFETHHDFAAPGAITQGHAPAPDPTWATEWTSRWDSLKPLPVAPLNRAAPAPARLE